MDINMTIENFDDEILDKKKEEIGQILMKEEIKEEDLDYQSSLSDKNKERLNFKDENSANVTNQTGIQNCLQKKNIFGEMTINKEFFEDPPVTYLDNIKDDCGEIPARKIKEDLFESCDGTEQGFIGQEPAVGCCDEMSQDWSVKEEDFGEILMKEEIKEEDLEYQSSLSDKDKESLNFKDENSANVTNHTGIQNCLQKKIECQPSKVMGSAISQSNSNAPLCVRKEQLKKKNRTIQKSFKCSSCPYKTAEYNNFKRHERTHTSDKPFKCSSCPYQAAQWDTLRRHERTHTGEKPFQCSYCSYKSAQIGTLKAHERTHTGEKPFKCSSCPYQAAQWVSLHRHKRTHTGEKPFQCSSCSYKSIQPGALKLHERTHTGEKPFKCSSCSYQAARMSAVKTHEKTHV